MSYLSGNAHWSWDTLIIIFILKNFEFLLRHVSCYIYSLFQHRSSLKQVIITYEMLSLLISILKLKNPAIH